MPHLQAYAALWLIIQMALGRERCKVHQDWATCLQKKQVTSGHSPRPNKDFVIRLSHGKTGEVFFLNINTVILEENERVSAQTIPSGVVNKLICLEIDRLHYRMNQSLTVFTTWLMNGHLWCTDTFVADVTGSHAKHICFVGVLQIKVVLLNLAAMFVCFSLDKGNWWSQQAFTFLYTSKPTSFLALMIAWGQVSTAPYASGNRGWF